MTNPRHSGFSRRQFLQTTGAAVSLCGLVPAHVLGAAGQTPPSRKPNLAAIGCGGMGEGDLQALAPHCNVVALCDVDSNRAANSFKRHPEARKFQDFRRMFDAMEKEIDVVLVATPDHTHAVAALAAIQRKKHVYCEKPLAHSVHEVRALMEAARQQGVVTQLGNQGHSTDSIRNCCEWIRDGAIGRVHTIHVGCSIVNSGLGHLNAVRTERPPVPANLDWDLWLGPAAERPYHSAYLPSLWRGWVPFGNGTVGDWMCHVVDPVFWALDLGAPLSVQAEVSDYDLKTQGDVFPLGEVLTYQFGANAGRGPITLKWFTGKRGIPRPPELEADEKPIEIGGVVMGDKGTMVYGSHGAAQVRLIPEAKNAAYKRPAKTIPRTRGHHADFMRAVLEGGKAGSDFAYGGPLTEVALLGVIALKHPGQKLEWDGAAGHFTNYTPANNHLKPPMRKGWEV